MAVQSDTFNQLWKIIYRDYFWWSYFQKQANEMNSVHNCWTAPLCSYFFFTEHSRLMQASWNVVDLDGDDYSCTVFFRFLRNAGAWNVCESQQIQREVFLYNGDMPECTCKHTVTAVHTCIFKYTSCRQANIWLYKPYNKICRYLDTFFTALPLYMKKSRFWLKFRLSALVQEV